jgi:anti-anti-sigma factor
MRIDVTGDDRVAVVVLVGRIDAYTAPEAETALAAASADGRHLVVDLSGADYISSAGLRVLITLVKRSRAEAFELRLCGLQPPVLEVFDIAGFTQLFEIRDSRDEALAELAA